MSSQLPTEAVPCDPLIGTTQWKRGHPSNVGVEGSPRQDEIWPGIWRWRQRRTKKWAPNCTCNDRQIHEHQHPTPDRNTLYQSLPSRDCSRSFASDPRGISSKSTTRPTDIKRSCPSCDRRGYADCTSCQAHTFPHRATEHHHHPLDCFVTSVKGLADSPAEFIHLNDKYYSIQVVTTDGDIHMDYESSGLPRETSGGLSTKGQATKESKGKGWIN